jgi:hypothetical protein
LLCLFVSDHPSHLPGNTSLRKPSIRLKKTGARNTVLLTLVEWESSAIEGFELSIEESDTTEMFQIQHVVLHQKKAHFIV